MRIENNTYRIILLHIFKAIWSNNIYKIWFKMLTQYFNIGNILYSAVNFHLWKQISVIKNYCNFH